MDVRVGIVSWQTAKLLDRCLGSLPAALGNLAAEVVVVDDASSDASADVARSHGVRVVANETNTGYARAINQAFRRAEAPFLIAINPDTDSRPDALARLVRALQANASLGLVAPRLLNPDGSLQPSVHRFPSVRTALVMGLVPMLLRRGPIGRRFWLEGYAPHDRAQPIDWAIGAVHAIRRSALPDPEHAYDERSFMYAEDMDLCWRLRRNGWGVAIEPAAEAIHIGNAAGALKFGEAVDDVRLAADYDWYVRRHGRRQARLWSAANMLGFGIKSLVGRARWGTDHPHTKAPGIFFGFTRATPSPRRNDD